MWREHVGRSCDATQASVKSGASKRDKRGAVRWAQHSQVVGAQAERMLQFARRLIEREICPQKATT